MTTLLEPPTIFAVGRPPNTFEGDTPAGPAESAEDDNDDGLVEEEEEV